MACGAAAPALAAGEVHVWRVPLALPRARLAAFAETLAADERDRAARFHFDRHRDAYVAARGALRALAAAYLGEAPAGLAFGYGARGKPFLAAPAAAPAPGAAGLRFNVSHSGGVALLAFARGRELGVDVEQQRALDDLLSLADTSFTPRERAALRALPAAQHIEAFFACWSRKEAFIKATGEGLAQLQAFDVNLAPGEPARLLRVDDDAAAGRRWELHDLPPIPGHAAALALEGTAPPHATAAAAARIACWAWEPPPG